MQKKQRIFLGSACLVVLIIFIIWTLLVANGVLQSLDESIVEAIVSFRGEKGGFWYWLTRITTELGFIYVMVPLFIALFIIFRLDLKSVGIAAGTGCTYIVNSIVKKIVCRPRPLEIYHWMSEHSFSFPSGHTCTSTFLYGFMAYLVLTSNLDKKKKNIFGSILIFIIPYIGFTRMILSVHYFSDVIGGMLLGSLMICFAIFVYEELRAKNFNFLRPFIDRKIKR